jgi:hypothetical protein
MSAAEDPRQILLEVRVDEPNLDLIEKAFQNSKIRTETLSKENPIRIRIPATTRAVGLLLILLEELAPKGKIILDDGSTLDIDQEGLSKLRRLAIRSLSNTSQIQAPTPRPRTDTTALQEQRKITSVETPLDNRSRLTEREQVEHVGFRSDQITIMTFSFLVIVGIAIGSATWLAIAGKIGELSSDFILGACIIGVFSVVHRYATALRNSRA